MQTRIFFRLEKSGSANSDFFSGWSPRKKRWVYAINPPIGLEKSGSATLKIGVQIKRLHISSMQGGLKLVVKKCMISS